ncbi:MAG: hypothetical protein BM562_03820 [Alphaproteobacteria bacterium MedPE-SWcel]|nr:MAG: hypothetical protein BM562_03820 [Alphaproteobacteria bacterium MedPE-SWcel]
MGDKIRPRSILKGADAPDFSRLRSYSFRQLVQCDAWTDHTLSDGLAWTMRMLRLSKPLN